MDGIYLLEQVGYNNKVIFIGFLKGSMAGRQRNLEIKLFKEYKKENL